MKYPSFTQWILKIDNEFRSRGLALIDCTKVLSKVIQRSLKVKAKKLKKLEED